jgi:hypothetical protein
MPRVGIADIFNENAKLNTPYRLIRENRSCVDKITEVKLFDEDGALEFPIYVAKNDDIHWLRSDDDDVYLTSKGAMFLWTSSFVIQMRRIVATWKSSFIKS